jgi:putative salt-induced outer membrane protein YdiY
MTKLRICSQYARLAFVVGLTLFGAKVQAQDELPQVRTAAEMLEALRAMGVELPEGLVVGEDGSVLVSPGAPDAGVMVPAGETPPPPPPPPPPVGGEAGAMVVDAVEEELEEAPEAVRLWKQRAEFSIALTDGDNETMNLRGAYTAVRDTDHDELRLRTTYIYETESEETTEHRFIAQANYDRDIADTRWLWFVGGRYDWSQTSSFRHRVSLNAGLGYRLIQRENMELILRAGGGVTREYGSNRNDLIPEGLLGADFRWDVSDRQGIESTFRYFPDLSELGEYRTETTLGWRYALDVRDGLSLTAGLLHEYDSVVDPGNERSNLRLFAGVGLDF